MGEYVRLPEGMRTGEVLRLCRTRMTPAPPGHATKEPWATRT